MRLASVRIPGRLPAWTIGVVSGGGGSVALMPPGFGNLDAVIRDWRVARNELHAALPSAPLVPVSQVQFGPPLRRFNRDILCTAWNYPGRQDPEGVAEHPTFFTKGPGTVIGPHDEIGFDSRISQRWDYEAEVAVVIGKEGRSIPADRALSHVFGYCIANDVSQRDLQRAHGGQWLKGKSIDGTMPLGPWITTADLVSDPQGLEIECELNGELVQRASTAQMAFDVAHLIAELSWGMTLQPGDVVLTGTPAGIGSAREPQVFLRPGDVLVTRVSGLGELRNSIGVAELATNAEAKYAALTR